MRKDGAKFSQVDTTDIDLGTRIAFVTEIARRLHQYGTAAPSLEGVINRISRKLGLWCQVLSTPTSIVMSCADFAHRNDPLAQVTQVIRLAPGEIHLGRLCQIDEIADRVTNGTLDIAHGFTFLRNVSDQPDRLSRLHSILSFGMASLSVAAILHTSWSDLVVAGLTGMLIGLIAQVFRHRSRLAPSFEAISALLATGIATSVSAYLFPLSVKSVVLASLITLLPGLTLTTAVRELSTGHLVSGASRMAGSMATLLKLSFGTVAAAQLCTVLHIPLNPQIISPVPGWAEWVALVVGCYSFAVLFRCQRRDYPLVMLSVMIGYLATYFGSSAFSPEFGVFIGGVVVSAGSNLYSKLAQRPGALVRLPGIIMLVPGSVGFRTLSLVFERDLFLGIDTAFSLIALLVSLVAGLLFGDLLISPRRQL